MALKGNISGSVAHDYKVGITGSVIIGRPRQTTAHLPVPGHDVVLFVSGAAGGKGIGDDSPKSKSTTVIAGDLVHSGVAYFAAKETFPNITNEKLVFSGISPSVTFFVSGANHSRPFEPGKKGVSVIGGDLLVSGGLIVLPGGMHNEDPKAFKDVSLMTTMFVSGTVKGDPPHISNTLHSIFGGDLVVSGGLRVGEGRGHHGNNTWYGGTISGSIHHTELGVSYLVAGNNTTVASASNGQVTIGSTTTPTFDDITLTGELKASDGTVGAPSITFSSDTNTGFFRSASDKLNISVGGVEVVEVSTAAISGSSVETGLLFSDSGDLEIENEASDKDIIFKVKDGSTTKTLLTLDADIPMNFVTADIPLGFGSVGNIISGSATPAAGLGLALKSNNSIWLSGSSGVYFGKRTGNGSYDNAGADVTFFVSGSREKKGTDVRGTAVFGGDVVTSGSLEVGLKATQSTNGLDADAFIVNTKNYKKRLLVDGAQDRVVIGALGNQAKAVVIGSDTLFFVSGAIGSIGHDHQGASVFGGDLVVSGAVVLAVTASHVRTTGNQILLVGAQSITGSDVGIFFSGSKNTQGNIGSYGTTLIGGDTYISGTLMPEEIAFPFDGGKLLFGNNEEVSLTHVNNHGLRIGNTAMGEGTTRLLFGDIGTFIHQSADGVLDLNADTEIEINATDIDMNGSVSMSGEFSVVGPVVINDGGADKDFRIEGGAGKAGMLLIDAGTGQVGILTDGTAAANAYGLNASTTGIPTDVSFFVSGSVYSEAGVGGIGYNGTTLVGGDLVVSGIIAGGAPYGQRELLLKSQQVSITNSTEDGMSAHFGQDVQFAVSGTAGSVSRGLGEGVSVFAGDVVVSGSVYLGMHNLYNNQSAEKSLIGAGRDVNMFVSGAQSSKDNDAKVGVSVFGGDLVVSGVGFHNLSNIGHEDKQLRGVGHNVGFFVSGSQNAVRYGTSRGVSVFGGDLVVSGTTFLGMGDASLENAKGSNNLVPPGVGHDVLTMISGSAGKHGQQNSRLMIAGDTAVSGVLFTHGGIAMGTNKDLGNIQMGTLPSMFQGEWAAFGSPNGGSFGTTMYGSLYAMNRSNTWVLASSSWTGTDSGTPASSSLLGIATGMGVEYGILLKGYAYIGGIPGMLPARFSGSWVAGQAIYMASGKLGSDDGAQFSDEFTKPASSGQFARLLGHMTTKENVIYFNPSNDWIVIE